MVPIQCLVNAPPSSLSTALRMWLTQRKFKALITRHKAALLIQTGTSVAALCIFPLFLLQTTATRKWLNYRHLRRVAAARIVQKGLIIALISHICSSSVVYEAWRVYNERKASDHSKYSEGISQSVYMYTAHWACGGI